MHHGRPCTDVQGIFKMASTHQISHTAPSSFLWQFILLSISHLRLALNMRSQLFNTLAVTAPTVLFLAAGNHAMPVDTLHRRGYQGVASLINAVYDYLKDKDAYVSKAL
jgi:hypothetical protein